MKELEYYRKLYLAYLGEIVSYGQNPRPRVRNIKMWREVQNIIPSTPLDLTVEHEKGRKIHMWSDLHFGHKNVIRYCDRPFLDLEQMKENLMENFIDTVDKNDISIWGGDIGFMGNEKINNILREMPGYKILIIGNHDFNKKKLRKLEFDEIHLVLPLEVEGVQFLFTHYPMSNLDEEVFNVHGHIHNDVLDSDQHFNISVESPYVHYMPLSLDMLIKMAKIRITSRDE